MTKYYFTFGQNHRTISGRPLCNYYVTVTAEGWDEARDIFLDTFAAQFLPYPSAWSFQYEADQINLNIFRGGCFMHYFKDDTGQIRCERPAQGVGSIYDLPGLQDTIFNLKDVLQKDNEKRSADLQEALQAVEPMYPGAEITQTPYNFRLFVEHWRPVFPGATERTLRKEMIYQVCSRQDILDQMRHLKVLGYHSSSIFYLDGRIKIDLYQRTTMHRMQGFFNPNRINYVTRITKRKQFPAGGVHAGSFRSQDLADALRYALQTQFPEAFQKAGTGAHWTDKLLDNGRK